MKAIVATLCGVLLSGHAFAAAPVHKPIHKKLETAVKAPDALIQKVDDGKVIPSVRQEPPASRQQTLCLALNLYHEARSEPLDGQRAVGHVVLNRMQQSGKTICQVIFQPGKFSWTRKPIQSLIPREGWAWSEMQQHAFALIEHDHDDPTEGATMFYNARLCSPVWAYKGTVTARIGPHVFVRL